MVGGSRDAHAEYMRNIEASPWLGSADLVKTENKHGDSRTPYEFELVVHLGKPKSVDDTAPASGASAAASAAAAASNGGAAQ